MVYLFWTIFLNAQSTKVGDVKGKKDESQSHPFIKWLAI